MSKEIIKDTNWRGVPCTLRYSGSLKPVCVGDKFDNLEVTGGRAPHKADSSGYMSYKDHRETYVNGCYWDEDFEPNAWVVMLRYKKKVVNPTTGKKERDTWSQAGAYSIDYHGDDYAFLMAHGKARVIERYNSNNECYVKAVHEPDFD